MVLFRVVGLSLLFGVCALLDFGFCVRVVAIRFGWLLLGDVGFGGWVFVLGVGWWFAWVCFLSGLLLC